MEPTKDETFLFVAGNNEGSRRRQFVQGMRACEYFSRFSCIDCQYHDLLGVEGLYGQAQH